MRLFIVAIALSALGATATDCQSGAEEDVVSLMQVGKPTTKTAHAREHKEQKAKVLDEHPQLMYNWGNKWDEWYDDLIELFPPTHDQGIQTLNYGLASQEMHACAADIPAGDPMISPFNHTAGANLYATLASKSPVSLESAKVLEISSGRGGGSALLSDCFCPKQMIGLDFSPKQVSHAKTTYERDGKCPVEFLHGDAMDLPFDDDTFDVVMNVEASHTYPSYRKFVQEARRVLRPGGALLTTDFRMLEDSQTDATILSEIFEKPVPVNPIDVSGEVLRALGENQKMGPFVARCFETYKAQHLAHIENGEGDWKLHEHGMGAKNPLGCTEMAGQFVQLSLGTGIMNYRMYVMTK